ncbi:MAG: BamA/TamA family outer membrane protein [Bacteroidota bacterium]
MWRINSFVLFLCFLGIDLPAQMDWVFVESIEFNGNRKTKERTILREMDFASGDSISISELANKLEQNRLFILNTGLFILVKMNIKNWNGQNNHIQIEVRLQENWYIYPFPVFELADRNFNIWWEEFNRSLKRVNYGIRFYHINTTGRRDQLKLVLQRGFTQKYELSYTLPALDGNDKLGLTGELFYKQNKDIGYITEGNRLLFQRNEDEILLQRFRVGLGLLYRPGLRSYHQLKLDFQRNSISEYVRDNLNPNYFLGDALKQRLLYLRYEYIYDNRDFRPYPQKGNRFSGVIEKEGLGVFNERNGRYVSAQYAQYLPIVKRLSLELIGKGRTALIRGFQPYNNYWAMGYGEDFLRGYEFYVIDGLDYIYLKSSLRINLLDFQFNWGRYMLIPQFRVMPFRVYLTFNSDMAYVNDTQTAEINPLGNRWLWGGGFGLDFLFYNDKVIQIQYSFNDLGENGLFLHLQFIVLHGQI